MGTRSTTQCNHEATRQWWYCAPTLTEVLHNRGVHNNATAWKPCTVGHQGGSTNLPSWHTSRVVPHGNLITGSTWIFDQRCGTLTARFEGTARLLQSYFAVPQIVTWLCSKEVCHFSVKAGRHAQR